MEDQLLSVIVGFERKELEEQRERLIQETRFENFLLLFCHLFFFGNHKWDALRDLVTFLQFKKREKHLWNPTLLKLTPLHGCFSRNHESVVLTLFINTTVSLTQ